jgi:formylglycine-generating enzyme
LVAALAARAQQRAPRSAEQPLKAPPVLQRSHVEPRTGLAFIEIPAGVLKTQGGREISMSAFELGATEVTTAAYELCVRAASCSEPDHGGACNWRKPGRGDHPINCVDQEQAKSFCYWINATLPTSSEWEYAATGGEEARRYPWGSEPPGARACWDGEGSDLGRGNRRGTCAVGSFKEGASRWGVLDLAGNVWEWTSGRYQSGSEVRGGSWYVSRSADLRVTAKNGDHPEGRNDGVGFRCRRSVQRTR